MAEKEFLRQKLLFVIIEQLYRSN